MTNFLVGMIFGVCLWNSFDWKQIFRPDLEFTADVFFGPSDYDS